MEGGNVEIKVNQERELVVSGGRAAAVLAAKEMLAHMGLSSTRHLLLSARPLKRYSVLFAV